MTEVSHFWLLHYFVLDKCAPNTLSLCTHGCCPHFVTGHRLDFESVDGDIVSHTWDPISRRLAFRLNDIPVGGNATARVNLRVNANGGRGLIGIHRVGIVAWPSFTDNLNAISGMGRIENFGLGMDVPGINPNHAIALGRVIVR